MSENPEVIDTKGMTPEQRAALEMTEAAREASATKRGFAAGLFMGEWNLGTMVPYPMQSESDRQQGERFLHQLEALLRDKVDADAIDRTGEIPDEVISELAALGAFGIKIPQEYGGLGLSQTNYCRAAILLAGHCGSLTALVSAHQSIGVPQPLLLFGTDEQKKRFLPRVAKGEISAFALTEGGVGSDPARMVAEAVPTPEGDAFILNGEKLWCTNGCRAGVIIVMARTPARMVKGRKREQITAFLLETNTPGVTVLRRCRFMGLRALYNAVVRFENVRIPRENIIMGEGKGLRVALTTLNTGRLTLPAAAVGMTKRCLKITRRWASNRVQWGSVIGRHEAVAEKIARMSMDLFAMEAMTLYAASLVDRDANADIRLEAAMCKLWATEAAWRAVDDTMQIRGGRGYETADSLAGRGEEGVPVERFFRDARINTIFEGSSEIMRLFIAREALDPHLQIGGPVLHHGIPAGERARAAMRAGWFYAHWYPSLMMNQGGAVEWRPELADPMRWGERAARRMARSLFHAMARYGPKLERRQILLGRFVDIGTELFAMAAAAARAQAMVAESERGDDAAKRAEAESAVALASAFCERARLRIGQWFNALHENTDAADYRLAQRVLKGEASWLERGISS